MRHFFGFLSLFMLVLLVVDRAGSWGLNQVYLSMRGGQNGGQIVDYLARPQAPELLIMGNSRVYHNIDPDSFHRGAVNLAHNGTGQVFHTGVLRVLQQEQKLPAALVLHIDLDEYVQAAKPDEIRLLNFFYQRNSYVTEQINALGWPEQLKNFSALYRHNGRVFSVAKAWLRPELTSDYGFKPIAPSLRDSINTLYSAQRLQARSQQLNRAPLAKLKEFVAVCKAEGLPLVCFTSPYYLRPPHLNRTSGLVDSLLRAEHVAYLNYGLHPVAELQRSTRYWRDDTHLNALGIPLLSQDLTRQVNGLLHEAATPAALAAALAASNSSAN
jgi:hypothetical protein